MASHTVVQLETVALRVLMVVMALASALTGISLLSSPWAVPLVVVIFIIAAATTIFAVCGTLPSNEE